MSSKYLVHEAARDNKPLIVQNLLAENPQLAVLKDEDSRTPLHWACTMNNEKMVDIILPFLKKVDLETLADDGGWTPVHIAAATGNQNILDKLMKLDPDYNIDLATGTGTTCLHLAVSKNYYDMVKSLLDTYKCSPRVKDKKSSTPLHRAAAIGSQPIVKMLAGAKVSMNAKDSDGWTPLHHALAEGHGDVGVSLVQLGADAEAESNSGETPAQVANNDSVRKFFEQATK